MEQEPQLFQKQSTSKTKKIFTVSMLVLLIIYWLITMTPIMNPYFSFSTLVDMGGSGIYFYVPIVSTMFAIILLFFAYNLNNWDKLFKIVTTLYIYMMISYIMNMIFTSIYYRYATYDNNNLDLQGYASAEPSNLMLATLSMSILAEFIALVVIWFYTKIDISKNEK